MNLPQDLDIPRSIKDAIAQISSTNEGAYAEALLESYAVARHLADEAKKRGLDTDASPMSQEVCDMPDRLEATTGITGIAEFVRKLGRTLPSTKLAFKVAEDIALGHFGFFDKEQALNLAVRAAISIVTSSVSIFPAGDITTVVIKRNGDGTSYPAVVFGRIEGALTPLQASFLLILVDKLRVMMGLDKYHVNSVGDDEIARFVEEVGIYEREHLRSPRVLEADVRLVLQNVSVELDGVGVGDQEVISNRNLQRIKGNKIRAGALQVLIEGIVGRPARVLEMAKTLDVPEWDWLINIRGRVEPKQQEDPTSYILNAKPGRPVLSIPDVPGGFRLRYGRAENTGYGSFGFHPAVFELLGFPLSTGTRIKISLAERTGSAAITDSLTPPTVRLSDGEVRTITSAAEAIAYGDRLDKIINLGDVLASPDEFLYSGEPLEASGYVEEWWILDARRAMGERRLSPAELSTLASLDLDRLTNVLENPLSVRPTLTEALKLCDVLGIPLHPDFTYLWELLSISEIFLLRGAIVEYQDDPPTPALLTFSNSPDAKRCLEVACVPHKAKDDLLSLTGDDARAVYHVLAPQKSIPLGASYSDTLDLLKFLSGSEIRRKSSKYIGVAMRKAEISSERKMRPSAHLLFPVGTKGIPSRDVLQSHHISSVVELSIRSCPSCGASSPYKSCPFCEAKTSQLYYCPACKKERLAEQCPDCKSKALPYMNAVPRVQDLLRAASDTVGLQPYPPLKGISRLSNSTRTPERLEKGILRQRHNLTCFKDGTIRYDVVNAPLTHFKPSQFQMTVKELQDLGYTTDMFGRPLESDDQTLELKLQDVILPQDSADHFKRLSAYIDDLLSRFFKASPFYNVQKQEDILGALVVGISPKASLGVVGRIIGFTDACVCFAHPSWHSAKYRNCGGDVDSLTLLLDVQLNFSPGLCPNQVTGLVDTPSMIEPVVLTSNAQRRPTAFDQLNSYPSEFFIKTNERPSARSLEEMMPILTKVGNTGTCYQFTHWSTTLVTSHPRSSYSNPEPMPDKVSRQIATASKIRTVDVDGLVSSLLNNYFVEEIIDNLDAYSTQRFRCKGCGEAYRRPPIKGTCLTCGRELTPSVTLSSVEKFVLLANELIKTHQIAQPVKDKVTLALENLQLLTEYKKQTSIADFT